jgi:hypothetical protein
MRFWIFYYLYHHCSYYRHMSLAIVILIIITIVLIVPFTCLGPTDSSSNVTSFHWLFVEFFQLLCMLREYPPFVLFSTASNGHKRT